MKHLWIIVCAVLFTALPATASDLPATFADLVEKLSPAVVNISTVHKVETGGLSGSLGDKDGPNFQFRFHGLPGGEEFEPFRDFFERFGGGGAQPKQRNVKSLGSGFVIDEDGYIVTNHHVVAEADEVTVTFQDDSSYDATVVGRDAKTDLALLKIDAKKKLPAVTFGNSDDMRVGDWVIAIGNPFGLGGSVSAGIISARSRNINAGPFDDFIQTDAAINRGNSGGPLFNIKGEVIGVNSAIYSPSGGNVGIGFAIPSMLADPVLTQLREFGRTHRGWLGVKIQHVTDELAEGLGLRKAKGALVVGVNEDSPADEAGVEVGDVIIEFNGKDIDKMRELPRLVAETKIGQEVELTVWRKGREKELDVKLGELDEAEQQDTAASPNPSKTNGKAESYAGLSIRSIDSNARKQYDLPKDSSGVLVLDVKPDSIGANAKLRRGDIIVEANQQPIDSVKDLKSAIAAAKKQGRDRALLRVDRGGNLLFLTIATKE